MSNDAQSPTIVKTNFSQRNEISRAAAAAAVADMEVMQHCADFLQPTVTCTHSPRSCALIVLNYQLPSFTPALWDRGGASSSLEEGIIKKDVMWPQLGYEMEQWVVCSIEILSLTKDALILRYKPDVIKGDLDSIRPEVLEFYGNMGSTILDESNDQDTTDLHKCVTFIRDCTPDLDKSNLVLIVVGALGGRFDHELGNINILYTCSDMRIVLLSNESLLFLLPKTHRHEISVDHSVEGPHYGLMPVGGPSQSTTTSGLQWDLNKTPMRFGSLISTSNVVRGEKVTVCSDVDLLWTTSIRKL